MFKQFLFYSSIFLLIGCSTSKVTSNLSLNQLDYSIEEATDWTDLFHRNHGWFGGDGIFALPINGKENEPPTDTTKNLIWFSDSMIGDVVNGKPKNKKMVNNSVAILTGTIPDKDKIEFYWNESNEKIKSLFIPNTPSSEEGDYYWLGDGFKNEFNGSIYIFGYRMHNEDAQDDWSFRQQGLNLIALPKGSIPPFTNQRQIETPFFFKANSAKDDGSFGAGILVNTKSAAAPNPDGYIYVYGTKGLDKNLVAARVKPENFEAFEKWRFWDGNNWTNNIDQIAAIVPHVSNELSVSPLKDGRFLLVFQEGGMSNVISIRIGASPVGPFGQAIPVYETKVPKENKNYFAYNAKAHPSLSGNGELLISYNINSFDFFNEIEKNPTLYRPRFFKLIFK